MQITTVATSVDMTDDALSRQRMKARERFKPDDIRYLMIDESPPRDERQYFYFTDVQDHDGLFIETMDVLFRTRYPMIFWNGYRNIKELRQSKQEFLHLFRLKGFHLIEAVDRPIAKGEKGVEVVRACTAELACRVLELTTERTKVILI